MGSMLKIIISIIMRISGKLLDRSLVSLEGVGGNTFYIFVYYKLR